MAQHVLPIGHPWRGGRLDGMLAEFGAEVVSNKGHLKIRVPGATELFVVSQTPSDVFAESASITIFNRITGRTKTVATVGERRERKPRKFNREESFMEVRDDSVPVEMGECKQCGKAWTMEAKEYLWFEEQVKREPANMAMPRRCAECRAAKRNGAPLNGTVMVKPGITVTYGKPAPPTKPEIPDNRTTRQRCIDVYKAEPDKGRGVITRVAKTVGCTNTEASKYLKEAGLYQRNQRRESKAPVRAAIPQAPTVESLSSEEEQLRLRLAQIERKKSLLLEAKRLKFERSPDGKVLLKKEGNVLPLTESEAHELPDMMLAFLSEPVQTGASQ